MYKILLKCKFKTFQNLKKEALCLLTAPRTPIPPPISFSTLPTDSHHNSQCPPANSNLNFQFAKDWFEGRGNVATEHSPRVRDQFWPCHEGTLCSCPRLQSQACTYTCTDMQGPLHT